MFGQCSAFSRPCSQVQLARPACRQAALACRSGTAPQTRRCRRMHGLAAAPQGVRALIVPPAAGHSCRAALGKAAAAALDWDRSAVSTAPAMALPIPHQTCPAQLRRASARAIVVAMSGGVDSSVVAALLQARRATTSSASPCSSTIMARPSAGAGACCAGQDIHDARRVADRLGIPHYVLDYEQRFKATVMQSFADSYAAGETPIPCVTCNQQIKFQRAADDRPRAGRRRARHRPLHRAAATGPPGPELYRARDAERDQSYFLFATTPRPARLAAVSRSAAYRKAEVRALARELRAARRRQVRQPGHLLRAARAATPTSSSA